MEKDMFLFGMLSTLAAAVEAIIETHPDPQAVISRFETTLAIAKADPSASPRDPEYEKAVSILATQLRLAASGSR